jgi:preprotein translocase subunit SecA
MAGRGTDIKLGGNPESRAARKAGGETEGEEFEKQLSRELESWRGDYQGVRSVGGLHVLGTERHDSRRIDNQLRGRSGRQGDPGSSRFYISLDDDLMRLFGGENLKGLMGRMGMQDGEPIFHPWVNKAIERAQKRVEERNFEIRKHLLEYDDVLNEQRKFIYGKRDEILADPKLERRLLATAEDLLDAFLDDFREQPGEDGMRLAQLFGRLKEALGYTPREEVEAMEALGPAEIKERVLTELQEDLNEKSAEIGKENLNMFIRFEYLRQIDTRWQDHLESLEALREAVYLRAYGQKNPLLEYKLEGFQIFDAMLEEIRTGIAKKIFQVRVKAVEPQQRRRVDFGDARHVLLGQFGGPARSGAAAAGAAGGPGTNAGRGAQGSAARGSATATAVRPSSGERHEAQPQGMQVRRSVPKVGRNDPCPCGSGKKYKYCHGQ